MRIYTEDEQNIVFKVNQKTLNGILYMLIQIHVCHASMYNK